LIRLRLRGWRYRTLLCRKLRSDELAGLNPSWANGRRRDALSASRSLLLLSGLHALHDQVTLEDLHFEEESCVRPAPCQRGGVPAAGERQGVPPVAGFGANGSPGTNAGYIV
jgi:hypothetical protein